ncbi:MAG: LLM class F420-dependent oxidoreductase, partial [Acidimicrobiales bacterium]
MRFGIKTAPQHTTWDDMLAVWQTADAIDEFESAWLFDHFYPIFSDSDGPCMESFVTLTALAQATSRIRVGSMVNGIPYRHPAVLANMAASLDIVSRGRLELGLGAGWNEQESGAYGIDLGTIRQRMDRFEEAVEVIVGLLSEEETSFSGQFFTLADARNEPKGPQRPHPPIVIGGGGEKRTLRVAARFAQHWNMAGGDLAAFRHKKSVLAQHCADIGRDPAAITCSIQHRVAAAIDVSEVVCHPADPTDASVHLSIFPP